MEQGVEDLNIKTTKEYEGYCQGNGNSLCFYYSADYTDIYICKCTHSYLYLSNSLNYTLKMGILVYGNSSAKLVKIV